VEALKNYASVSIYKCGHVGSSIHLSLCVLVYIYVCVSECAWSTCRVHEVDAEEVSFSLSVGPSPNITLVRDTRLDRPSTAVNKGSREWQAREEVKVVSGNGRQSFKG
jgi:hypothetical protein